MPAIFLWILSTYKNDNTPIVTETIGYIKLGFFDTSSKLAINLALFIIVFTVDIIARIGKQIFTGINSSIPKKIIRRLNPAHIRLPIKIPSLKACVNPFI